MTLHHGIRAVFLRHTSDNLCHGSLRSRFNGSILIVYATDLIHRKSQLTVVQGSSATVVTKFEHRSTVMTDWGEHIAPPIRDQGTCGLGAILI